MTPRPRAAVVVTGSELVRGQRTDLNGPFLARELTVRGLEPDQVLIVGDGEDELAVALQAALRADLCVTSGGLGPTHDDRTVALVARSLGLALAVDETLHGEIERVSRAAAERLRRPYADFEPGVRKQATIPKGAVSLGLAGTAPGLVIPARDAVVVVLPGPPRELQRLWPRALETEPVRALLALTEPPERRVLRFFGASESEVARALEDELAADAEVTICARDFEIVVEVYGRGEQVTAALRDRVGRHLFAEDERPVEELVVQLCRARGWSLATAESCTGGMVAERVTGVPGASDVFLGSIVAYGNGVKEAELGVPARVLREHGAVSAETAAAMAHGVRARLGADVGVAVTGIAGPGGGTPDKPVGLVHLHAATPEQERSTEFVYGSDRDSVRRRAAVAALHLVRRLLSQSRDRSA